MSIQQDVHQIAWAAGLFEGEGSIVMVRRPDGYWHRSLNLNMTDEDVVRRFAEVVGVGTVRKARAPLQPHHKQQWHWSCQRWEDIAATLRAFLPYFGDRRRAKAMLLLMNPAQPVGGKVKTHCKRGHELSGDNVYVHEKSGVRNCRACIRIRRKLRAAKSFIGRSRSGAR